jgi:hypothetical protein
LATRQKKSPNSKKDTSNTTKRNSEEVRNHGLLESEGEHFEKNFSKTYFILDKDEMV